MNLTAHQGRRIAFFGGSFDPPHRGHLTVARAAQLALGLDSVLFAPVSVQPLKPLGSTASFADRLAMTELAIEGEPNFSISLADAPSADKSHNFTIDTLLRLRCEIPARTELYCLMGADSFHNLRFWHRGAEIPFVTPLIVAARPGQQLDDLAQDLPAGVSLDGDFNEAGAHSGVVIRNYTMRSGSGACAPFFLLPGLHVDISATEIRRQIQAADDSLHKEQDLLPPPVRDYIAVHDLYR
jgi:nicotinate-nucleotide adenylyltransferase